MHCSAARLRPWHWWHSPFCSWGNAEQCHSGRELCLVYSAAIDAYNSPKAKLMHDPHPRMKTAFLMPMRIETPDFLTARLLKMKHTANFVLSTCWSFVKLMSLNWTLNGVGFHVSYVHIFGLASLDVAWYGLFWLFMFFLIESHNAEQPRSNLWSSQSNGGDSSYSRRNEPSLSLPFRGQWSSRIPQPSESFRNLVYLYCYPQLHFFPMRSQVM